MSNPEDPLSEGRKIELMLNLRESCLRIWGLLLSVGLAAMTYIAIAGKEPDKIGAAFLMVMFFLFACSNLNALRKNFLTRIELGGLIEENTAYAALIHLNLPTKAEYLLNLLFHIVVDILVLAGFFSLYGRITCS